jgi:hypothetical protein
MAHVVGRVRLAEQELEPKASGQLGGLDRLVAGGGWGFWYGGGRMSMLRPW